MANLIHRLGDSARAHQLYEKALAIAERLVRENPGDADCLMNLSSAYNSMGNVMRAEGAADEAAQFYKKAIGTRQRLADRNSPAQRLPLGASRNVLEPWGSDGERRFARRGARTLTSELPIWLKVWSAGSPRPRRPSRDALQAPTAAWAT